MAPSLRAILSYAGSLVSQIPLSRDGSPDHRAGRGHDDHHAAATIAGPASSPGLAPMTSHYFAPLSGAPSCPIDGPTSCNNATEADSCCFVYPGGRLLLTQFWDQKLHVGGAEEDWTVHGLWPDLCDGSFDQFCGMAPAFNNITATLEEHGQGELVEWMHRYWVANYGSNDHLWAHEYNKHGTCINTLSPSCYGDGYSLGVEVVDYFTRAAGLFRMLDTYRALERVGIVPDYKKTYALADLHSALEAFSGGRVILRCTGRHHNVLHEAWYVYFVKGSLQSGEFVPAKDSFKGDHDNCAAQVRYLPKRKR